MLLSAALGPPSVHLRGGPEVNIHATITSIDARRGPALSGDCKAAAFSSGPSSTKSARKACIVTASLNDASGDASGRETAERRRALLQYVREVQPALVEQFMENGPPAVVAAMKNTITNMLGTLPPQFFTVTINTVGENMSQLMLSVMMTGYLFRNAQYRVGLHSAVQGAPPPHVTSSNSSATQRHQHPPPQQTQWNTAGGRLQRAVSDPQPGSVLDQDAYAPGVQKSRVQGDVLLWHKENGLETLGAVQYIELLEVEVARLRQQLGQSEAAPRQQQQQQVSPQEPVQQDRGSSADGRQLPVPVAQSSYLQQADSSRMLPAHAPGSTGVWMLHEEGTNEVLDYLRGLDAANLSDLTRSADSEVAFAMEAFVGRLMGTTDRDSLSRAGSDCTAQELAQVMLWLMIVGYTLRGLEVRWDMQRTVLADDAKGPEARFSCQDSHEAW